MFRDYIPEDGRTTAEERARFALTTHGGGRPDFIPGADHELAPPSGREGQADEALERAIERQAAAAAEDYFEAVKKLKDMNVAQAVQHIRQAPYSVMEMLLVAEMENGGRKSILDRFPEPDPSIVEKYRAFTSSVSTEES